MTALSLRVALAVGVAQTLSFAAVPPLRAQTITPVPRASAASAGDSLRTDAIPLSLAEAVERGVRLGEEVRLVESQVDATSAQVTVARAASLPQLRLAGSYQQVLENARATIVGSVFGQNYTYTGNANLSQPLFQGGRIVAGLRAASRVRAASRLDLDEARAQQTVDVQRAYLGAQAADQLVGIQERNLALSTERVTQAEQLERAGRAARYDVLRARVERANLEPLLIQARADRELAYLELRRLLNLPTDRPLASRRRSRPTRARSRRCCRAPRARRATPSRARRATGASTSARSATTARPCAPRRRCAAHARPASAWRAPTSCRR